MLPISSSSQVDDHGDGEGLKHQHDNVYIYVDMLDMMIWKKVRTTTQGSSPNKRCAKGQTSLIIRENVWVCLVLGAADDWDCCQTSNARTFTGIGLATR